jgi:hypothetical protein
VNVELSSAITTPAAMEAVPYAWLLFGGSWGAWLQPGNLNVQAVHMPDQQPSADFRTICVLQDNCCIGH